jgi:hypothetical protein
MRAVLTPNYLVVAYPDPKPPHQLHVAATELAWLFSHWKALHAFTAFAPLSTKSIPYIPFAAHDLLDYEGRPLGDPAMEVILSALPSALRQDVWSVVVCAGECRDRWHPRPSEVHPGLVTYGLATPGQPWGWHWRPLSTVDVPPGAEVLPKRTEMTNTGSNFVVWYYR